MRLSKPVKFNGINFSSVSAFLVDFSDLASVLASFSAVSASFFAFSFFSFRNSKSSSL